MQLVGQVGPQVGSDGSPLVVRQGKTGELDVSELLPRYTEQVYRGNVFLASTGAAITLSTSLVTTTSIGFIISNPASSGKLVVPFQVEIAVTTAVAGVIAACAMPYSALAVTHTTALTPQVAILGGTQTAYAKVDSGATLPLAPVVVKTLFSMISTNTSQAPIALYDFGGSLILGQGTALAIQGNAALTAFISMSWMEISV